MLLIALYNNLLAELNLFIIQSLKQTKFCKFMNEMQNKNFNPAYYVLGDFFMVLCFKKAFVS